MGDASVKQQVKQQAQPKHWFWGALFSSLIGLVVLAVVGVGVWLYLDGAALKLVLPDPKPGPPKVLSWDNQQLGVMADAFLVCEQRMGELLRLRGCHREQTPVNGAEIVCGLEAPWEALRFGCGPYPDEAPAERLTLTGRSDRAWDWILERAQGWFGDCRPQAIGPSVTQEPRWVGDQGVVACFWFGGFRQRGGDSGSAFPSGFWVEYEPLAMTGYTADAWRHHNSVPQPVPRNPWRPLALRLDVVGLNGAERAHHVQGVLVKLFTREGYVRPKISLEMEAYSKKQLVKE